MDNINREDHLLNFIKDNENQTPNQINEVNKNIENFGSNTRQKVEKIEADSDWIEIPIKELPYGRFYKVGTRIFIRPAKTKEIESFAVINEKNDYDVFLKINELLSACTKLVFEDGTQGGYRDLQNGDRQTIIIIISRATVQKGKVLHKTATCSCNTEEIKIDLMPSNYVYKTEDEDITPFFNADKRVYEFELYNGNKVSMAPPTIGITEDINTYIFYQTAKSGGAIIPNISFMQAIPYMKAGLGVKKLSREQVEQEEYNFSKMNDELFMFIHDVAMNKLNFGVEKLKKVCTKCGEEVQVDFGFPNGPRALFIVPNAFKQFIRQRV